MDALGNTSGHSKSSLRLCLSTDKCNAQKLPKPVSHNRGGVAPTRLPLIYIHTYVGMYVPQSPLMWELTVLGFVAVEAMDLCLRDAFFFPFLFFSFLSPHGHCRGMLHYEHLWNCSRVGRVCDRFKACASDLLSMLHTLPGMEGILFQFRQSSRSRGAGF